MICEPIMLRCCVETSTSAYTQQGLPWLTFFRLGDKVLAPRHLGRTYPMWVAAWFQIFVTSIRVLHRPLHWATWFLKSWSDGFDWLGTRSNQTWHEWISSRRYICLSLSTLLQGSLLDHVFKKLPLTDSLSVNATIRRPARPGHHAESAIKRANISSSWIMVCWSFSMVARMKDLDIFSRRNPIIEPLLV